MKTRILFFIASSAPTPAERAAALALNTGMFRNVTQIAPGDSPEQCDGVAGLVPASYSKFKRMDEAPAPVATADTQSGTAPGASVERVVVTDPAAEQRAAEDEGARSATVAQLKAALTQFKIEFPPNAKKADLLALFLARPAEAPAPVATGPEGQALESAPAPTA